MEEVLGAFGIMNINSGQYKKISIVLSPEGLRAFPSYLKMQAYWIQYISVRPKQGRMYRKGTIPILFQGHKTIQTWHKDYWLIKKTNEKIS